MTLADKSRGYVTPVGRVRYGDDVFEPPADPVVSEISVDRLNPELVERFNKVVDDLTDEMMASGSFDRASCRADAITLLIMASERLQPDKAVESPLQYFLMEERQRAAASLGMPGSAGALTMMKA